MPETQTSTGRRRTLLPWMGGKSRLAARIISLLPPHTTYVEPFCGGCAVFFRKERSRAEILNDRDDRLVALLRVFRFHPDALLREIEYLTHSRTEFRTALTQPGVTDVQRAARFLLVVKAGFDSKISSPTFGYGLTGKAHFSYEGVASLIAAARERLDGVTIECLDFADVIARYDSPGTLFYCDPPYIGTAGYACRFTMCDHERLRDALAAIKGRAVVSLNDCPDTRQLYNGWDVREAGVTYSVGGKATDRAKRHGEVVIRAHWGIENQLHYILDMSFDEDRNRIRAGDGAENMAVIRHIAMNYLSQAKHLKVGIKNRRNLAAISTDVLQRILEI